MFPAFSWCDPLSKQNSTHQTKTDVKSSQLFQLIWKQTSHASLPDSVRVLETGDDVPNDNETESESVSGAFLDGEEAVALGSFGKWQWQHKICSPWTLDC